MKLYVRKSVFLLSISGSLLTAFSIHDYIARESQEVNSLTDEEKKELKEVWFNDPVKTVGGGTVVGAVSGVLAQLLTKKGTLESAIATGAFIGALGGAAYGFYKAWKFNKSFIALDKTDSNGDQPSLSTETTTSKTGIFNTASDGNDKRSDDGASPEERGSHAYENDVPDFIEKLDKGFIQ